MLLNQILIGLGLIIAGVLMVKYTFWLRNTTGPMDWLEHYTGSGSTYGIYKIFGVVLVLFGFLVATGFGVPVLRFLLSPLAGAFGGLQNN